MAALVKWFLTIPHLIVLVFLYIGVFFAVIGLVRDALGRRPLDEAAAVLYQ